MNGRTAVRLLIGALAVAAIGSSIWIISLPNQTECRASGRIVDPIERHCDSSTGYQQLQEHATFHAVQVAFLSLLILAVVYIIYRVIRRHRMVAPPA